jgi:hypothetical protein
MEEEMEEEMEELLRRAKCDNYLGHPHACWGRLRKHSQVRYFPALSYDWIQALNLI